MGSSRVIGEVYTSPMSSSGPLLVGIGWRGEEGNVKE